MLFRSSALPFLSVRGVGERKKGGREFEMERKKEIGREREVERWGDRESVMWIVEREKKRKRAREEALIQTEGE